MNLRFYRSFSTEMMKMASEPRLKLATRFNEMAIGAHDLSTKNKVDNRYQHARDYAAAAGKGAFTAAAALGLKDKMTGVAPSPKAYRRAIGVGAGAMVVDRAYRHRKLRKAQGLQKKAAVQVNVSRAFQTPATSLAASRKTGGFMNRVVKTGLGKPPKVVQMGKKFRTS